MLFEGRIRGATHIYAVCLVGIGPRKLATTRLKQRGTNNGQMTSQVVDEDSTKTYSTDAGTGERCLIEVESSKES